MSVLPVVGEHAVDLVGLGAEGRAHLGLGGDVHRQAQVLLHQPCIIVWQQALHMSEILIGSNL